MSVEKLLNRNRVILRDTMVSGEFNTKNTLITIQKLKTP